MRQKILLLFIILISVISIVNAEILHYTEDFERPNNQTVACDSCDINWHEWPLYDGSHSYYTHYIWAELYDGTGMVNVYDPTNTALVGTSGFDYYNFEDGKMKVDVKFEANNSDVYGELVWGNELQWGLRERGAFGDNFWAITPGYVSAYAWVIFDSFNHPDTLVLGGCNNGTLNYSYPNWEGEWIEIAASFNSTYTEHRALKWWVDGNYVGQAWNCKEVWENIEGIGISVTDMGGDSVTGYIDNVDFTWNNGTVIDETSDYKGCANCTELNETFNIFADLSSWSVYGGEVGGDIEYSVTGYDASYERDRASLLNTSENIFRIQHYDGEDHWVQVKNMSSSGLVRFLPGPTFSPSVVYLASDYMNVPIETNFSIFIKQTMLGPNESDSFDYDFGFADYLYVEFSNNDFVNIKKHEFETSSILGTGESGNYLDLSNVCNISDIDESIEMNETEYIVIDKTELESCYGSSLNDINISKIEFKMFTEQNESQFENYFLFYDDLFVGNKYFEDYTDNETLPTITDYGYFWNNAENTSFTLYVNATDVEGDVIRYGFECSPGDFSGYYLNNTFVCDNYNSTTQTEVEVYVTDDATPPYNNNTQLFYVPANVGTEEPVGGGGGGGAPPEEEKEATAKNEVLICNPGYEIVTTTDYETQLITEYNEVTVEEYVRERSTQNTCGIDADQDGEKCDLNEDIFSCPEDCKLKVSELFCLDNQRCMWTEEWALRIVLSLQMMFGIYLMYVLWLK